ncbi:hypothetical protein CYMTET_35030 [Cymbomonas tetramitiformis]|uniref:Uncharacterized protein n=1 Tax=Cymbomonas tetramitiformis TaxID=36881 RepID=A0AAE0F9Z0_9CHLO|nr:hypothetical protein CYMTET_35030 [Cymbomonas tetramitiformis]
MTRSVLVGGYVDQEESDMMYDPLTELLSTWRARQLQLTSPPAAPIPLDLKRQVEMLSDVINNKGYTLRAKKMGAYQRGKIFRPFDRP